MNPKVTTKGKSKWDFLFEKFKQEPVKNPDLFAPFKGKLPTMNDIKVTVRNFSSTMKTYFIYGEKDLNENGINEQLVNRFKQIRFDSHYIVPENINSSTCIVKTVEPTEKFASFEQWKQALSDSAKQAKEKLQTA
jgi:hypothetical protein